MRQVRLTLLIVSIMALSLGLAGCNLFRGEETPDVPGGNPPVVPTTVLFSDDFKDAEVGEFPDGWRRTGPGTIEIVADDDLESGKAVRVRMNSADTSGTHFMAPHFDLSSGDPEVIVGEFMIRPVETNGLNVYVSTGSGSSLLHHVNFYARDDNTFYFRGDSDYLTDLVDGWNRVRFVADRVKGEAVVYVNDMETPHGPFVFREPTDTWEGAYFYVLHPRNQSNTGQPMEAVYGNFTIWSGDSQ